MEREGSERGPSGGRAVRVGIVVPILGTVPPEEILATLQSVHDQSFAAFEVLVLRGDGTSARRPDEWPADDRVRFDAFVASGLGELLDAGLSRLEAEWI